MSSAHIFREFFMAVIIAFLAVAICLSSVVFADDLSPVSPSADENPQTPPSDNPDKCPPPEDEWVPWPIEGPEDERIFTEKTGSSGMKFTRNNREEEEELEAQKLATSTIYTVDPEFSAFLINNPSSHVLYNSLISRSIARIN